MYKGKMRLKACMMLTIFVMTFVMSVMLNMKNNVETVNAATRTYFSYSQIKDTKKCDYVNMMMNYYVNNNTDVINALKTGKSVVMMFEGASNNITASHIPSGKGVNEQRVGALCVVLKYENGKAVVKYTSQACSTIPDQPLGYGNTKVPKMDSDNKKLGAATLIDGVYKVVTCNHNYTYAALNIQLLKGSYYVPAVYMKEDGSYVMRCAEGINVHTRRGPNCSKDGTNASSEGCILVSTPGDNGSGNSSYNNFIDYMYSFKDGNDDINVETKIQYVTDYGNIKVNQEHKKDTKNIKNAGVIVIDRYLYKEHMITMYKNKDAVDEIVKNSMDTYDKALDKEMSGGLKASLNFSSKVLEKGSEFEVDGVVSSNCRIKYVRGIIKKHTASGDYETVKDVTVYPYNSYCSLLNTSINEELDFSSLGEGDYMFTLEAVDKSDSIVYRTRKFSVTTNSNIKIDLTFQGGELKIRKSCSVSGTVSSDVRIKKISGQIVNSSNEVVQEVIICPNAYMQKIAGSRIDNELRFGQLGLGTYRLVITAEDYSGKVVKVQKYFKIV